MNNLAGGGVLEGGRREARVHLVLIGVLDPHGLACMASRWGSPGYGEYATTPLHARLPGQGRRKRGRVVADRGCPGASGGRGRPGDPFANVGWRQPQPISGVRHPRRRTPRGGRQSKAARSRVPCSRLGGEQHLHQLVPGGLPFARASSRRPTNSRNTRAMPCSPSATSQVRTTDAPAPQLGRREC